MPHSCRAASTSKAKKLNVNMEDILKQGCWKNMKTFKKHHEKEIIYYADDDVDFMKIINQIQCCYNVQLKLIFSPIKER